MNDNAAQSLPKARKSVALSGVVAGNTAICSDDTQKNVLDILQIREELYERIGYHDYERRLDALFKSNEEG